MFYAVSGLKQKSQTVVKGTITFGGEISFKETVNVNGQNKTIWEGGIDPDPIIPGNSD
jgi:hypothetical protein